MLFRSPVFSTTTPSVYSGRDHYEATLVIDKVPFLKGSFDITVFLVDEAGLNVFHQVREKGIFQVKHEDYPVGFLTLSHRWLE